MRKLAFCILALAVGALAARAEVALVRGGKPVAKIVVLGDASAAPAQELQRYVERMSGAKLDIVGPEQAPASGAVFVGAAGDFANLPFRVELGPQAFARKTVGADLYVIGGDAKGVGYAVCDLLEEFGCRWFMPGEIGEVMPHAETIIAADRDTVESPAFESRQMWYAWGAATPEAGQRLADWQRHNKVGCLPFGHGHNFSGTLPPEKYFAEHPEYYALVNGQRQVSQLCTTNPDVIHIAIAAANRFFDENPDHISYSLCPDDNASFCQCPACSALDLEMDPHLEGKPNVTDRLMVFWNAVAEGVQMQHPGKRVAIYAYINHTLPPKREKVHPGVMPIVTTSVFCPIHSVADPGCASRQELRHILQGWTDLAEHVYIYEYDPVPGYAELPCPLFGAHARSMKVYRDLGIKGFSFETHQSWATTFLNFYMLARLTWNPDEDPEAILDDMCEKFFGAAAAPMRRYYRLVDSAFSGISAHTTWGSKGLKDVPAIWTPEIMRSCRAALNEALAAADNDMTRRRVEMVDLGFQYLEAFRTVLQEPERDYDAAASAAERCGALIDHMFALSDDYIVAHEAHNRVDELKADLVRYFTRSAAFRRNNDIIAILPEKWRFHLDPDNDGVGRGWASRSFDDWGWRTIRTDEQWYRQVVEPITGYGWARTRVLVPNAYQGRRIILRIGALDEQGWIYVNGRLAYRRKGDTYDAWRQPFECDITGFIEFGKENTLVIRAYAERTLGGLWRGALLYSPR